VRNRSWNGWLRWRESALIGNDIVDLADPQAVGKHRDVRFMDRVFTPDERRTILSSDAPDTILWSLWAAKETGYKAMGKLHPALSSAPKRYPVRLSGAPFPEAGIVETPCGPISLRFDITGEYVHCIGATADEDLDAVVWNVHEIPHPDISSERQSDFLRNMTRETLSRCLNESPESIEIVRQKGHRGLGPPEVYFGGKRTAIDISMSHDGRFAACAISVHHG